LLHNAQSLDSEDSKVRSVTDQLHKSFIEYENEEEVNKKKQRARDLLCRTKSIESVDVAIKILEEVFSIRPGDLDAASLLDEAQKLRSEFLQSMGQVATLEQAGQYEEAIKEINDLIARGFYEYDGHDIFELRSELEKKQREFTDQKAEKYYNKAEAEVDNNPKLALSYIEKGLSLLAMPKVRRDALEDLKIKVELAIEQNILIEKKVRKMVDNAQECMKTKKYAEAIVILERAVALMPNFSEVQIYLDIANKKLKEKLSVVTITGLSQNNKDIKISIPFQPKVFISYCTKSKENEKWTVQLAKRLVTNGVDVVFDKWDLKPGQNIYVFMEQMVNNPEIHKVLMICDREYKIRADNRKFGSGEESQIISYEIYKNVYQEKFVPLVCEYQNDEPCLPTFLKGTKYLNFLNEKNFAVEYKELLKFIYEIPLIEKPVIGKPPADIFD